MNVFKLEAAIGLNTTEYQKGLSSCGESLSKMGDKIKSGVAAISKVTAAGVAAAATGVAALAKSAVSAYADYEQLVGGVEKLFGESSDLLMLYAKDAATSAGMSVNEYMETATSFAAALTTSVKAAGGSMDEAVEYADTAMRDMSDNANTFGTELSSIQTAYQGFAKQNYTMLDNLKLGYGGTKAEMERLIEDANELRRAQGINNELTIESYADIITAIHTVQTEMQITGTTAREASKTISGSINSTKAAWKNLTIEIAKEDGDISGAFAVLGENVGNVMDNILPRVEQALGGVGQLITAAAPQISRAITTLIPKLVPSVLKSGASIVSALGKGLLQAIPSLMDTGISIMAQINDALRSDSDSSGILGSIANDILERIPTIFRFGRRILDAIADDILNVDYGKLAESIQKVFSSAISNITSFIKGIDFYKVGENIADFVNGIDWQKVANQIFDLLAAAIKGIGDIAVSFFANADLGNLMVMIGVLSAKSILGGVGNFFNSSEGTALTQDIGKSWSASFMAGIKAFGLGWAIGTYLRDNITIGDKTLGEWVDVGTEKLFGELPETEDDFNTSLNTGYINVNGKLTTIDPTQNPEMYKKYNPQAYERWYNAYGGYFARAGLDVPKPFANGGRVTQPTLAVIGEKEPETIIPDSKLNGIGNTTNYITINVDGYNIKNDEEFTELLSRKLSELSVRQQRAVGGAGW